MTYDWYPICNLNDFDDDLTSVEYNFIFSTLGEKTILVTKGEKTSILFDDVFLSANLNDENPFEFEGYAVYFDSDSNGLWLGILNDSD